MNNSYKQKKDWENELRYKWRGHVVVDDAFEDPGISLNADRIADWWLGKMSNLIDETEKQAMNEELLKELKDDSSEFVKIIREQAKSDIREIIENMPTEFPERESDYFDQGAKCFKDSLLKKI